MDVDYRNCVTSWEGENSRTLSSSLLGSRCDVLPQAIGLVKSVRALRLPEKLGRRSRIRRKTVKEANIGDFRRRKMHSSSVSFNRDFEQNSNCSALGTIIHLLITNCGEVQSGFFLNLASQGTLKRFVSLTLPPGNVQSLWPTT